MKLVVGPRNGGTDAVGLQLLTAIMANIAHHAEAARSHTSIVALATERVSDSERLQAPVRTSDRLLGPPTPPRAVVRFVADDFGCKLLQLFHNAISTTSRALETLPSTHDEGRHSWLCRPEERHAELARRGRVTTTHRHAKHAPNRAFAKHAVHLSLDPVLQP